MSDDSTIRTDVQPADVEARSLFADIENLIDDGQTLVEAEIAFQKTRLAYAGNRGVAMAIGLALAAILLVFALFALVFGSILGLAPHLGPWLATAVVVGALLLAAIASLAVALRSWRSLRDVFREGEA